MSPPVDTVVDRELDRARKDFMDLVRSTDRQVRRDPGDGRGDARRDRDGREPDQPTSTPRSDASRRAQPQGRQPVQAQPAQPAPGQEPRDAPRDAPLSRETIGRAPRRPLDRSGDRELPARVAQDSPNAARRPTTQAGEADPVGRRTERRDAPPPLPVGEREIDRRSSGAPPIPSSTGVSRSSAAGGAISPARNARAEAASLVMPTADASSLGLVASIVGLAPSPFRLNTQTPPEIARRIAQFVRTGELDRSPLRFAPPPPIAEPGQRTDDEADVVGVVDSTPPAPPRLLPPFAQIAGGRAPMAQRQTTTPSLFAPPVERRVTVERRGATMAMAIPMQAATLSASASAPDTPHVGSDPEDTNPFFGDDEMKVRERRRRDSQALLVGALRELG
ncbi:MAG: hypothetical protein MEP57_08020 [Microvirga sp.]|nr:hypothetical protein [Microvirga sp.]